MNAGPREGPKPRVCRRLDFTDEDDDNEPREIGENRENRLLEDLNRQHIESFTAKYNFDPRTETPLEGNFEWYRRRNNGEWERMPVLGQLEERQTEQQRGEPQVEAPNGRQEAPNGCEEAPRH